MTFLEKLRSGTRQNFIDSQVSILICRVTYTGIYVPLNQSPTESSGILHMDLLDRFGGLNICLHTSSMPKEIEINFPELAHRLNLEFCFGRVGYKEPASFLSDIVIHAPWRYALKEFSFLIFSIQEEKEVSCHTCFWGGSRGKEQRASTSLMNRLDSRSSLCQALKQLFNELTDPYESL